MNAENFVQTALDLGAIEAELRGGIAFGVATFERQDDAVAFVEICQSDWGVDLARRIEHKALIKFWKFK